MFSSMEQVSEGLATGGYLADQVTVAVIYLAVRLHKPLLLEGPAGSGKTRLAYAVAGTAGAQVERLQCYEGIDDAKTIGPFDEAFQRPYVQVKGNLDAPPQWGVLQAWLY